jgi:DNA repair ATPase RecN
VVRRSAAEMTVRRAVDRIARDLRMARATLVSALPEAPSSVQSINFQVSTGAGTWSAPIQMLASGGKLLRRQSNRETILAEAQLPVQVSFQRVGNAIQVTVETSYQSLGQGPQTATASILVSPRN